MRLICLLLIFHYSILTNSSLDINIIIVHDLIHILTKIRPQTGLFIHPRHVHHLEQASASLYFASGSAVSAVSFEYPMEMEQATETPKKYVDIKDGKSEEYLVTDLSQELCSFISHFLISTISPHLKRCNGCLNSLHKAS